MIIVHTCKHKAQDELHGFQRRVANLLKDGTTARCTVCKVEVRVKEKEPAKTAEEKK